MCEGGGVIGVQCVKGEGDDRSTVCEGGGVIGVQCVKGEGDDNDNGDNCGKVSQTVFKFLKLLYFTLCMHVCMYM